jgi:murein DD-endopeptidase MepM/ murein hydrolase activator NlpD
MKKILVTSALWIPMMFAQAQMVDISLQSQSKALQDSSLVAMVHDNDDIELTERDMIQETYQIPAYSLYDQYWDTENICSRQLNMPFGGNPLRIILVQSNNNPFFFPCNGVTAVMKYGENKGKEFHPGVDMAVREGSPVKCCFDGVVRMAKIYGDYGRVVVVRHYNGLETVYANLGKIMVKPGQILQSGDIIGASGKSSRTGAEQVHFETRFMNECFNPSLFIDFDYMEMKENTLVLNEEDLQIAENAKEETELKTKQENFRSETSIQKKEPATEKHEPNSGNAEYYTVKAGDTMYRISIQYHIPLAKLLQMNNMQETDKIDVGQKIRVK